MNSVDEEFFKEQICRTGSLFTLFTSITVVKREVS